MWINKNFNIKYRQQFSSLVWRLLISKEGLLLIEERDPGRRTAQYHAVDLGSGGEGAFRGDLGSSLQSERAGAFAGSSPGQHAGLPADYRIVKPAAAATSARKYGEDLLPEGFTAPDEFWSGVEAVIGRRIYFHGYRSAGMPFHKGIFVWDIDRREYAWKNEDLAWMFLNDDGIYAFKKKFETNDYFLLDYSTGEIIKELGSEPEEINKIAENEAEKDDFSDYTYPEVFVSSSYGANGYLEKLFPPNAVKEAAEVFQKNSVLFLNIHFGSERTGFQNELLAVDLKKEKVLKRFILNTGTKNLIAESCFAWKNLLFLVIDKKLIEIREIKQI